MKSPSRLPVPGPCVENDKFAFRKSRIGIAKPGFRWHLAGNNRGLMFLFFSNRLGCAGSLLISLAATAVLILVLRSL